MKLVVRFFIALLPGLCPSLLRGQSQLETPFPTSHFRFFAEAKVFIDLNLYQFRPLSHLRTSATVGVVGYGGRNRHVFANSTLTASCLLGRGLGASLKDRSATFRPQFVATLGFGAQGGPRNRLHEVTQFTQVVGSTFRSDYAHVISLASSWVLVDTKYPFDRRKRYFLTQRVGSAFVAFGPAEVFYYNDGTPFNAWAGDGKDRYFTGGGYVGYQLRNDQGWPQNRHAAFRISFDRYTSYEADAFELATALKFDHVPYANNATFYNRGSFRFGLFTDRWWGEAVINDNDQLDVQNLIHRVSGMAFHRTASKGSGSLRGGFRYATFRD